MSSEDKNAEDKERGEEMLAVITQEVPEIQTARELTAVYSPLYPHLFIVQLLYKNLRE